MRPLHHTPPFVCSSVLLCVASVLQVCYSVLQCAAVHIDTPSVPHPLLTQAHTIFHIHIWVVLEIVLTELIKQIFEHLVLEVGRHALPRQLLSVPSLSNHSLSPSRGHSTCKK